MSQDIIPQLQTALGQTIILLGSLDEKQLNTVPFAGCWTAAQVGRHIYKSLNGTDKMLQSPMPAPDRDPEQRAPEFKKIMLDFERKMDSPDFILPEDKQYDKGELIASLQEIKDDVLPSATTANLNEEAPLVDAHPLKGSTKLEIMHFFAYHTMRHNHQIEKIREALA